MAGQICESCANIGKRCYCSPNSTCLEYTPRDRDKLVWNVLYNSFSESGIKTFNVFDHWRFAKEVNECLSKISNKVDFANELRSDLFYYFCSKCEWEIVVSPWTGDREKGAIKIDVYDQVMMNWELFLDYVWSKRNMQ